MPAGFKRQGGESLDRNLFDSRRKKAGKLCRRKKNQARKDRKFPGRSYGLFWNKPAIPEASGC